MKTKNVVYEVPCGTDDGKVYIGQTGRMLETRINDHKNDIRKKEAKTGIVQHHLDHGHNFDFDNTKILGRIEKQESRTIAEAFHIRRVGDERTVNMQRECGGMDSAYNGLVKKEIRKSEKLKRERIKEMSYEPSWVENTTNTPIPEFLERTLMLGPNYNVPNRGKFPYIETLSEIEKVIKYQKNVEEIRADVTNAMSNFLNFNNQPRHHQQDWIAKDVGRSRKFLKENPDLLIIKADKGNKTVVLSSKEYEEKMEEMLRDDKPYEKIPYDPTARVSRKIKTILDNWREKKYIDAGTHRKLNVTNCNPPRIYGLPKIPKPGRPLRPVVSTIGSTTYKLAQYLSNILGKIVGKTEAHIINSFTFANEISGVQTDEDEVLFSLDVTSLYTNVPVDYVIECVEQRWNEIEDHTPIDKGSFIAAIKLSAQPISFDGSSTLVCVGRVYVAFLGCCYAGFFLAHHFYGASIVASDRWGKLALVVSM
ncbi:uncharacterized protein LOC129719884 [Wyeomyia smithii]|uniref:uncharacterized protein LOC129719884 n=1 Tax=Wyeomyia smithii TaxID=174621 RepID=UPI002467DC4F|nr:uncharacterized protein LOC129719884 [Wyeomyia smithii]